jgi:cell division septation protein DedD
VNSAPTQVPTQAPTQAPTQTPAQTEKAYKASTTHTTVATLDKDGNKDSGKEVHFTAIIADFVKDDNGNTAGANVTDPDYSAFVQVVFPADTDLSHLNKGDTIEIWGTDEGTFSGTNAFGATITEVGIAAQYMTDHTTGYHAG